MIALTGATGQLGHYVLQDLLNTVPASQIVAIVRNPAKARALSQQGVVVRQADYSDEAALTAALQGVDKLLLISSSEVGQRAVQHRNVINAAKAAGVKFIAYTSLLHADTSPLGLAAEHIETEQMLADSGIAYALLRNGWYTENYLASAPPALEHGVFIGAAGRVKSPPPPARIMPPLPPALSPVRVMKAKFTNWRVITPDAERPGCRAEQAKREKRGLPEPQRSRFRRRAEKRRPAGRACRYAGGFRCRRVERRTV